MDERYSRNLGAITKEEIKMLRTKNVCVVGCGGIGGYVIELIARLGIGSLTVVDGDSFVLSNLNRQLLSTEAYIGMPKAQAACERVNSINSEVTVNAVPYFITADNAESILRRHDVVMDALDSVASRRIVAGACERLGIPFVHGAISGWYAQIAVIFPGSGCLEKIYPGALTEKEPPSSLSFTPALAASIQTAEAVKVLLNKEVSLQSKLLVVDLLAQEYNTILL